MIKQNLKNPQYFKNANGVAINKYRWLTENAQTFKFGGKRVFSNE